MTGHLITRTFRRRGTSDSPYVFDDFQMLIDGEWCDMPLVPPCPNDSHGELVYDAMLRTGPPKLPIDKEFRVEVIVRVR